MIAWRIARASFADIGGEGARRLGGRWNSPGRSALYLSEHPALCLPEIIVHLAVDPSALPIDYVLMTVIVPDGLITEAAPPSVIGGGERPFGDS